MRRTRALALGALVVLAGCDLFGPSVGPPAEVTMSPLPGDLQVGASVPNITVTVRDKDGKTVSGASVGWTVSQGTITPSGSSTDGNGVVSASWTVGTTAGTQTVTASVGSLQVSRTATVGAGALAGLVVSPDAVTLVSIGDTIMLTATGADEFGNSVSASPVTWTSSAPQVATVEAGQVVSRGRGTAQIAASSGGATGTASVVVDQQMTGVRIQPGAPVMVTAEALQLALLAVDARGTTMDTTLSVDWTSSNPGVATVSADGLLEAVGVGTAQISGASGADQDEVTTTVKAGPRPTIASISPAVLAPGDTATITGTGFSATAGQNHVTVARVAAQVLTATGTQLVAVLPATAVFPCGPTGDQPVVVTVDELDATTEHPIAGATQRSLAVGESVALFTGEVGCNELAQAGTYLVSVFSTSMTASATTPFKLRGTLSTVPAAASATVPRERVLVHPGLPAIERDPEVEAHTWLLEQNLRVARELGSRHRPSPRTGPALRVEASVAVGETRSFRIPDIDGSNLCTSYKTVTARAVFSGPTAVIWEDEDGPIAGQMDARWQQVGQEYEQVMSPILTEYFGNPLAYDDWIGNPGQVHMLFSKEVNDFQRAVNGFVYAGDFFPRSGGQVNCESSDDRALFYGRIPTDPGSGYTGYTADVWAWDMRATIIHEVKHIVSYAERLRAAAVASRNPVFEAVGLEEPTARLAEEFYGRAVSGYGQGGNVTYEQSIWCERRVGSNFPQCDPVPAIVYKHFGGVYQYFKNVEGLSPLGPAVDGDGTFYGSGWLFVRWAMDHSGMAESAFSRALVDEPQLTGPANLAARYGRPFAEMVADYTMALATDDHPGGPAARPQLSLPGWNTRDIMQGLHEDHQGTGLANTYDLPWPLAVRNLSFGNFDADVGGIRGGTAAIFQLTGTGGNRQLLQLMSPSAGAPSAGLGMVIVRVQ